ncbi:MAG: chitobiase/beta-hexosaminidase C-terminal domain-containing protein [Prevotella sp.]|nr:chitobiase/beta-hexosaminidase C-terminal domain-containing protein [Prevotella sp.]
MRKTYSLIIAALFGLTANLFAADLANPADTLDFSVYTSLTEAEEAPLYGTFTYSVGTAANPTMKPNLSTSQKAFRLWPGNTFTMTANEGLKIAKIEITYTSSNRVQLSLLGNNGTFADGVWTGSAASVTFKNAASGTTQAKIAKIIVSYTGSAAEAVKAPQFNKRGVKIGGDANVEDVVDDTETLTLTAEAGCETYYTLDGTDPTKSSTKYTEPIVIKHTTTIKAISINEAGKSSEVVGYTYYINKMQMADSVVYYESFDKCLGYNGDVDFTQPNNSKVNLNRGGEFTGTYYAGNQCVYLARQYGSDATFTTPVLDNLGKAATLTFRIAGNTATDSLNLSATNAKLSSTKFVAGNQVWKDVTVSLSDVQAGATITFAGRNLFLDEVQVKKADEKTPTAIIRVSATTATDKDAPMFNVSGQRISSSYKGLVIQNGKKFIRR